MEWQLLAKKTPSNTAVPNIRNMSNTGHPLPVKVIYHWSLINYMGPSVPKMRSLVTRACCGFKAALDVSQPSSQCFGYCGSLIRPLLDFFLGITGRSSPPISGRRST